MRGHSVEREGKVYFQTGQAVGLILGGLRTWPWDADLDHLAGEGIQDQHDGTSPLDVPVERGGGRRDQDVPCNCAQLVNPLLTLRRCTGLMRPSPDDPACANDAGAPDPGRCPGVFQ